MGEPFSLALLGGAVLGEGVRFLFDQASCLIRAARERRAQARQAAEVPPVVNIVVAPNDVLDGPVSATVDGRLLDQENRRLIALTGALAPYASGDAEIDPADGDLIAALTEVRSLLESLYGQRFTLRGEAREPSGTKVDVRQVLGEVRGGVVGVEADSAADASIQVEQSASSVDAGGTVTGVKLGSIGARRHEGRA
jgi:hypothetical protein